MMMVVTLVSESGVLKQCNATAQASIPNQRQVNSHGGGYQNTSYVADGAYVHQSEDRLRARKRESEKARTLLRDLNLST